MKRFFCSKCKKIKYARHWPVDIENVTSLNPADRIGTCRWHNTPKQGSLSASRRVVNNHKREK